MDKGWTGVIVLLSGNERFPRMDSKMSNELKRALACKYCGMQMEFTLETKTATGSIHRLHCNNCSPKAGA
jgi:transcription elongation factor Elf1